MRSLERNNKINGASNPSVNNIHIKSLHIGRNIVVFLFHMSLSSVIRFVFYWIGNKNLCRMGSIHKVLCERFQWSDFTSFPSFSTDFLGATGQGQCLLFVRIGRSISFFPIEISDTSKIVEHFSAFFVRHDFQRQTAGANIDAELFHQYPLAGQEVAVAAKHFDVLPIA